MAQSVNRGKFGTKRGRPSLAALRELEQRTAPGIRAVFPFPSPEEQRRMARTDVRTVDPETAVDISTLDEAALEDADSWTEWFEALACRLGNPFLFKQDGYLVKLGRQGGPAEGAEGRCAACRTQNR